MTTIATRERPTLYVTNWASRKTPGLFGPGRAWTIMAKPRRWEHGEGQVLTLLPTVEDLNAVKAGWIDLIEYRERYTQRAVWALKMGILQPGELHAMPERSDNGFTVTGGDTLCCSCSKEAASRGECHRVWAAAALVRAGWRVVLDGQEVTP